MFTRFGQIFWALLLVILDFNLDRFDAKISLVKEAKGAKQTGRVQVSLTARSFRLRFLRPLRETPSGCGR
jgi:hypothetical protein